MSTEHQLFDPVTKLSEAQSSMGRIATGTSKVAVFFFAYFLTVIATLAFSQWVWPEGLQENAQFVFWPASGVAL